MINQWSVVRGETRHGSRCQTRSARKTGSGREPFLGGRVVSFAKPIIHHAARFYSHRVTGRDAAGAARRGPAGVGGVRTGGIH